MARNGCAAAVSVVSRDAGLLQRGHEVRTRGVNLVVADFFDAGARVSSRTGAHAARNHNARHLHRLFAVASAGDTAITWVLRWRYAMLPHELVNANTAAGGIRPAGQLRTCRVW